ncbi:MAG: SulP family inorganic anion transporter, partial [Gemmatimonadaceae bacterium]
MLVPKLVTTMKGYTRTQLVADLSAGVIVGIVALPLAIAFAIASGVTPDRGLWTAIVAGFLISALGGSRVQIGGPTGAFVVIVYGIVQRHGVDGLLVATLMAGIILVAMGLMRFGVAIKFIPHPLVIGFTTGIAVIIASTQVKDFLGLRMGDVPAEFVEKWKAFGEHITTADLTTVLVAVL